MKVTLEQCDGVVFLKLKRNDGKWAKLSMTYDEVKVLHDNFLSVFPGLAVHEDVKRAIEHLNTTINNLETGVQPLEPKQQKHEST